MCNIFTRCENVPPASAARRAGHGWRDSDSVSIASRVAAGGSQQIFIFSEFPSSTSRKKVLACIGRTITVSLRKGNLGFASQARRAPGFKNLSSVLLRFIFFYVMFLKRKVYREGEQEERTWFRFEPGEAAREKKAQPQRSG